MRRFIIVDGTLIGLNETSTTPPCEGIVESDDNCVRFIQPSWRKSVDTRPNCITIPLDLLEQIYQQKAAERKVVKGKTLYVVPSEEGLSLRYGDLELKLDKVGLDDFMELCEVLVEEKEELYAIFND